MIVHWIVEILLQGSKHCNPLKKHPILGQFLKTPFRAWNTPKPEKTADILRRHHCFPRKMTSEEQVAASDWLKPISLAARPVGSTSQLWVVTCHQYEFLRSFLRRNFEGKPMVASCFSGCKTVQGCPYRISSCWVNTTIRRGIKRLGISFGSIFVLFSNKSSRGALS